MVFEVVNIVIDKFEKYKIVNIINKIILGGKYFYVYLCLIIIYIV